MDTVWRSAEFDITGRYRYRLDRKWADDQPAIALIMLNPSRADHQRDDPTLRRCLALARHWHCGSLVVVNLFAYCTASPKVLQTVADPVGADNDRYILQSCRETAQILLAWGNGGSFRGRDHQVLTMLAPYRDHLFCLGVTRSGHPRHPLYLPRQTQPRPWVAPYTDSGTDAGV